MARGIPSPAPATLLPKVSFVKIQDSEAKTHPAGVHDLQARTYGYNDFSPFQRPEPYIRYIEPLESDLAKQVEYDMDEQDQEWLDALNTERKHDQLDKVTYEAFEIIMDQLEKEWFNITKNIPKTDMALPSEDSTCAICDDSEGENSNAIVFCDGCNLAVHQDCYGVPYIPEGQWLCRKCTVSPEIPVSCILCPNEGGAFKQTVTGEWAHLLCAIWVPETRVANDVFMEPITGIDKISKQRWKLKCSLCGVREGACVQCSKTSCFLAFHATCARKEKFLMPMKSTHGSEPVTLACYCEKHLPKSQQDIRAAYLEENHSDTTSGGEGGGNPSPKSSKTARAYAKTYKLGPPLVPHIIYERILNYISKMHIRKKSEFLQLVCRYWSLKREARRGAPLLKRLHLEPWTASNANKQQTDAEKATKLEHMKRLRKDLETVRLLAELSKKRETQKLKQSEAIHGLISSILFPHEAPLRLAFERIMGQDRHDYFKNPVSKAEVPDYFDVVKKPMCWNTIDAKLDRHEYWDVDAFKNDVMLVLDNAMLYNKWDTPFYKTAQRMKSSIQPVLAELDQLSSTKSLSTEFVSGEHAVSRVSGSIGTLEPPLPVLELFLSEDLITDDIDLILGKEPIMSLFNYEFEKLKPPPPPKPVKSKSHRRKPPTKDDSLDSSPGFRAPRTRRAAAAAAAFEAEVGTISSDHDGAASTSASVAEKKRWKKTPLVLPGQSEVPPVVDDVDKHRSFTMFDEGWILPEGQRRGGRTAVERHELPPPKKRIRNDRSKSRLSVYSTPALENQTLDVGRGANMANVVEGGGTSLVISKQKGTAENPTPQKDLDEGSETDADIPSVPIIIEELDSPAIRREKNMRRKAEKARLAAEAEAVGVGGGHEGSGLSELSDLSDLENEEAEGREDGVRRVSARKHTSKAKAESVRDPGVIVLEPGKMLEGGTLVWGKADTFPWWAAVVFEPDDPAIPMSVLKDRNSVIRTNDGPLHLVQFYDRRRSWQWLELEKLKLFGEDDTLDSSMLVQRFKTDKMRNECRASYREAKAEMESKEEAGEEGANSADTSFPTQNASGEPVAEDTAMELAPVEDESKPADMDITTDIGGSMDQAVITSSQLNT